MIARSMASDHSTHASTLSGCGWVSAATVGGEPGDGVAVADRRERHRPGPHQRAVAGRVRMRCWNAAAAVGGDDPLPAASPSTARVWLPTSRGSAGEPAHHRRADLVGDRSRPRRARSSTASAICVSSVHSPGSQPNPPPPSSVHGAVGSGPPNSYGAPIASPAAEASTAPTRRDRSVATVARRRRRSSRWRLVPSRSSASLRPPQKSSRSRRRAWRGPCRATRETVRSRPS